MLQAQLRDPFGREITLLDNGQLGFSIGGMISSIGSAIAGGAGAAASAAGSLVNATTAVSGGLIAGLKPVGSILSSAASLACGVVQNSAVQQGAGIASQVPNPYAQGAATGVQVGNAICNMANPPRTATSATAAAPAVTMTALHPMVATAAAAPAAAATYPAGTVTWKSSKTGMWVVAVPKAVAKSMGLGATPLTLLGPKPPFGFMGPKIGLLGAAAPQQKFQDAWPYGGIPAKNALYMRQYNWTSVKTADSPYLATWGAGLGGDLVVAGSSATQPAGVTVIAESEGESRSTPIYKKWWFWAAIGGGLLATGTATYFVVRKRKS